MNFYIFVKNKFRSEIDFFVRFMILINIKCNLNVGKSLE